MTSKIFYNAPEGSRLGLKQGKLPSVRRAIAIATIANLPHSHNLNPMQLDLL